MGQPFVKGQTIDQRFQRRSGAAQGPGHIDKALPPVGLIGRRPDRGENLARAMIGHHDRHLQTVALARPPHRRPAFQAVPATAHQWSARCRCLCGVRATHTVGQVRGQCTNRAAVVRHRFAQRGGGLVGRRSRRRARHGPARGRVPPRPRPRRGPGGGFRGIAEWPPAGRLARASGAWVPCRNRQDCAARTPSRLPP